MGAVQCRQKQPSLESDPPLIFDYCVPSHPLQWAPLVGRIEKNNDTARTRRQAGAPHPPQ
jgi:hypothetical protein